MRVCVNSCVEISSLSFEEKNRVNNKKRRMRQFTHKSQSCANKEGEFVFLCVKRAHLLPPSLSLSLSLSLSVRREKSSIHGG